MRSTASESTAEAPDAGPGVASVRCGPVRRAIYVAAGIVLVGIGAVGVFVPGLPTTIWLMAASYLFVRSSPRLEARLIRNRFFGPYLIYLDRPASMPRRAKVTATVLMCGSSLVSAAFLVYRGTMPLWGGVLLVLAAVGGSIVVWRMGRRSV